MNFYNIVRYFSISTNLYKNAQGRFLQKVMKGTGHKSRKWTVNKYNSEPVILNTSSLTKGPADGTRSVNSRRVTVLNKMFMRYITDLMATGENAAEFQGKGIEINRVMVAPDFTGVNVFWIAKGTEYDEQLEKLLTKNAGSLRHELSQLRVMGVVPKINFVRDKEFAKLMEVDVRLAKADFGEDHVPVEPSYLYKSISSIKESIPTHLKEKIEAVEENDTTDIEDEELLPPMRNDTLGLDHAAIMHRVMQLKKKSQAPHRYSEKTNEDDRICTTYNEQPIQFESQSKQMEAFHKFLVKRQVLKARANRTKDKYSPENDYLRQPSPEILDESPLANEFLDSEKDFIEEIEDNYKV